MSRFDLLRLFAEANALDSRVGKIKQMREDIWFFLLRGGTWHNTPLQTEDLLWILRYS
jgi:hypothetical protein